MKKFTRGFTLIELLVVIAIIGILSSIILVSLSTARNKAKDAKIQGQVSGMRSAAEIYFSTNNSYGNSGTCTTGMFADPSSGMGALVSGTQTDVGGSSYIGCGTTATGSAWAVQAKTSSGYVCADSTGKSWATTTSYSDADITVCP